MSAKNSRIAVKHVNVMDRYEERLHPMAHQPMPALVRRIDPPLPPRVLRVASFWDEFDDRTLGDLVGSGLLGQ